MQGGVIPPEPPIPPDFGSGGTGGNAGGMEHKSKDEIRKHNNDALIIILSHWITSKDNN